MHLQCTVYLLRCVLSELTNLPCTYTYSRYVLSDLLLLCKVGGKGGKDGEQAEMRPFLLEPIEEIKISWAEYPGASRCASFPFPAEAEPPSPSVAELLLSYLPGQEQEQEQGQGEGEGEPPSLAELRVHASGEAWLLSLPSASELARLQQQLHLACGEIAEDSCVHRDRHTGLLHTHRYDGDAEEEEEAHAMAHAALVSVVTSIRGCNRMQSRLQPHATA